MFSTTSVANRPATLLQNEIDLLTTSLQDADTEKMDSRKKIKQMENQILEMSENVDHLSQSLDISNSECHKLRKSLKKAEKDKIILENELTSTLGDFDRLNTKYEKKVKRLSALLQDLSKAKDSATFKLMKKEEHINQINNELDVVSSKL